MTTTRQRLEHLRKQIRCGNISYREIAELQLLSPYIQQDDLELLAWVNINPNQ